MAVAQERRSLLYETHRSLGAKFVPFAGWELPVQFSGIVAEHHAVRNQVGLFDVSHMGRLRIEGPAALTSVDRLVTNSLMAIPDGRGVYGCCCNDSGMILDDLICYRESTDRIFVVCNASNHDKIAAHFRAELKEGAELHDISDSTGLMALQGPLTPAFLESLGAAWAFALPRMGFRHGKLAGYDVTVALTGYTGELGVEIVCNTDDLVPLYETLIDRGRPLGLLPTGLGCRDTLRLEARLSLYGNEIDETTNPLEAGLGWTVKLNKPDFVGKQALLDARARGPNRTIVGIEMLGRGIARHGYALCDHTAAPIGSVTSGGPSPTLNKNIALGYVPLGFATVGTRLLVDCRGRLVDAQVVATPFYKRPAG